MVKIIFLVICLVLVFGESSMSATIECDFNNNVNYSVLGRIYQCVVKNNPNIISDESAVISGINGNHQSSKTNNDVLDIYARDKTIQVFPKDLEKFFNNIKAIRIENCKLKEIHQNDLKAFPHLVFFYLNGNEIEVIEEGLFDFNPNLEYVGFWESKIIHIDANVFDNLSKLSYFRIQNIPCTNKYIDNSREQILEAIKVVKSKCSNSEFLTLDSQIKNLEIESKTLDSQTFTKNFDSFEKTFKNSKFSKFRPLNYKFEALLQKFANFRQLIKIDSVDSKLTIVAENIKGGQNKIDKNFEDLKLTQCGLESPFMDLKYSQSSIQSTVNALKSTTDDQGTKLDQIQNTQTQLKDSMSASINNVLIKVSEVSSTQGNLKSSLSQIEGQVIEFKADQTSKIANLQDSVNKISSTQNDTINAIESLKKGQNNLESSLKSTHDSSLINLTSKFNKLEKDIKSTQDDTKLTLTDIEVKLSDHKSFQNDVKDALLKVRTMQNEMKLTLNDVKNAKNDDFEVKLSDLSGKVDSLEGHFGDLKAELGQKLDKNEKEFAKKLHKMSTNFDEKVKGIEKRLVKKFEEILEKFLQNLNAN